MRAIYNEKFYNSVAVPEINGEFEASNLTTIDSKKTVKMHYLAEVLKEAKDGKTEVQIVFTGEKYYIPVK